MIVLKIVAIIIFVEFIGMLIYSGKTASGITWFISHPFGKGVKMIVGLLIRVALLILAAAILF